MLHKSFKPAKCKTALKLVVSRAKLLKNKKEVLVKQLRRDLAKLLELGQVQTARIRVEHVVREEKMMAAYELIEIFCELIAIRLPIIESQKTCPIDLKEAVSSILFATPRCSDIPELVDVRKHFTAKYGKEFVSAAIELRPNCGVNRTLVEKLSAKAPDGPTKLKILTAIAEEHNIKWDPKSFGEKDPDPQEDLLNGPKAFESMKSSNVQAPYYDRASPSVHISPEHEVKQEGPINYHANNIRSSFGSQNVSPTHVNASAASNLKPSDHSYTGNGIDRMASDNLYSKEQNPNFVNQQNWNMEFKDATSAAQAAAESAERASMAARAAAELSSRGKIMTQYSTGSQSSSAYASTDEMPGHSGTSIYTRGQTTNNLQDKSSRSLNEGGAQEQHNFMEHTGRLYGVGNMRDNIPSELPGAAYTSDSSKVNNPLSRPPEHQMSDENSQSHGGWNFKDQHSVDKDDEEEDVDLATLTERLRGGNHRSETGSRPSSSNKTSGDSFNSKAPFDTRRNSQNLHQSEDVVTLDDLHMRGHSQKFEVEHSDETQDVLRTKETSNLEEERFRQCSSRSSSYSRSSLSSSVSDYQNDVEPNSQNLEDAVIGNPFANFNEEKNHEDAKTTEDSGFVVFDDYGSDGENSVFDLDKVRETSSHIFSPDRKLTSYQSENIYTPSPRRNRVDLFGKSISELHSSRDRSFASVFSESLDDSAVGMHEDELPPVIFDDARGAHSKIEVEPESSESDREDNFSSGTNKSRFSLMGKGSHKFDDQVDKKNQVHPLHSRVSLAHEAYDDTWAPQRSAVMDDSETPGKSSSVSATELSFGRLTGGIRNKVYRDPSYARSSLEEASSSEQAAASETKKSPISNPSKTWSRSETADDANQEESTEAQKKSSTAGTYRRSSSGEASAMRTSLENTAKRSSFSLAVHAESNDPEVDLNTHDKDVDYKRPSGRLEEKSMRNLPGEAPLSRRAAVDSPMNYGLSSPPRQISGSRFEWNNRGMDSATGKRTNSPDSISSYDSEQSKDPKEEVLSQVSGSRARYGAGLSRRTKGSPSKTDSSSPLKPSSAPREEETRGPLRFSSRSSYTDRRSEAKTMYPSEEDEIQDGRPDVKSTSHQERRADIRSSSTQDRMADLKSSSTRGRRADVRSSSRSSYDAEAYSSARSENAALDNRGSSSRLQSSKNTMAKPKSEPKKSSEQPSDSPQISGSSGPRKSSKAAKPSLGDTSRENSFNRASHVHPKLPDYDTIAAQLELLRANRK